jgi:capsular polysaccharide biosynthesis protein
MSTADTYEDAAEENEADIVEWYEARPVTVSTAVATGSIVAAFALGVLTAVGALALLGYMDD